MGQKQDSVLQVYRRGYTACEEWLKKEKTDRAIACYQELADRFPDQIRPLVRLAEIEYRKRDLVQTLIYANRAIDLNANEAYAPMTFLANRMKENRDEDLAIKILNRLLVAELDTQKLEKVQKRRLDLTVSSVADRTPVPGVSLRSLGDSVNSKDDEYFPSLSLDAQSLVFTRKINGADEDFFIAHRDSNGRWRKALNMGSPPNTGFPDGAAALSADGYYLFYTRCDMRSPNGIEGGGCDLVFSYLENGGWSSPQYFGYTLNTTAYEGQPCLSSDNRELYFVSNREGGYGGMDIWVSRFVNNFWTKPVNLGPTINTPGNETAPFIHPDNESLYFASDGHPGLGGSDIFLSRKNKNGTWKKPINLGAPVNSEEHEMSVVVDARGKNGYMASKRPGGKGGLDLYSFNIYPAIAPVPTLCLKGYLIDKFYKNKLYERPIDFTYTYNGLNMGRVLSNEGDASYAKALQMGKTYQIAVREPGYRSFYKTLPLLSDTLPENLYYNIRLRQPGFRDTLFCATLRTGPELKPDSASVVLMDSLIKQWPVWTEDSATIVIFLKGRYYCCDSLADTLYLSRLQEGMHRLQKLAARLEKGGIACHYVMQDLDMITYNDEEDLFDEVEVKVVECY